MSLKPVPAEILRQLGGNMFCVMVGAKNFVQSDDMLQFDIGGGARQRINKVRIKLTADDLYDVSYYAGRGVNIREVAADKGIYNDMLVERFVAITGFAVRL